MYGFQHSSLLVETGLKKKKEKKKIKIFWLVFVRIYGSFARTYKTITRILVKFVGMIILADNRLIKRVRLPFIIYVRSIAFSHLKVLMNIMDTAGLPLCFEILLIRNFK